MLLPRAEAVFEFDDDVEDDEPVDVDPGIEVLPPQPTNTAATKISKKIFTEILQL